MFHLICPTYNTGEKIVQLLIRTRFDTLKVWMFETILKSKFQAGDMTWSQPTGQQVLFTVTVNSLKMDTFGTGARCPY